MLSDGIVWCIAYANICLSMRMDKEDKNSLDGSYGYGNFSESTIYVYIDFLLDIRICVLLCG
ncbi:hypothetical protein Lalb_Chr08g0236011 [Lupinus albus]|uniref:Uncharacterized protein n=1 Tax=Lupinus albus TaxID=3870 RepID=A0A6A4Q3X6_LUPAL|nr:hypothetical protein Lalb_Chr08g0236011 [Lupinus albus]